MFTVKLKGVEQKLSLCRSLCLYLSGIEPERLWNYRGLSGHDADRLKKMEHEKELLNTILDNREEFIRENNESVEEISSIFKKLLDPRGEPITELFNNKSFYFVIGHMRSGGTYLLKNMMELNALDLKEFYQDLIHDGIPAYEPLFFWHKNDHLKYQLLFELAQFLFWIKKEWSGESLVFKKRIAFAHALPLLDEIFGESAHYVFTIRHPGESMQSFADLMDIQVTDEDFDRENWRRMCLPVLDDIQKEWEDMNYYEQFFCYWFAYHLDAMKNINPSISERFYPLKFGPDFSEFLASEFNVNAEDDMMADFSPNDRDRYSHIPREQVEEAINRVSTEWEIAGLDFPNFIE